MYKRNIELLRLIGERFNTGTSRPNYSVKIRRKNKEGDYETAPFNMRNLLELSIDRRYNMAADELTCVLDNKNGLLSPDYSPQKIYTHVSDLPNSGYKDVILPFNEIQVELGYGDELRRIFTGQIVSQNINEEQFNISITCKNEYRKLLKPIDPITKKSLVYENKSAFDIVKDLLERAGVKNYVFDMEQIQGNDFTISKVEFELGTFYSDAIKKILDTMGHRIFADRNGSIQILKRVFYKQEDFHIAEIDDYINMTSGEYVIDSSILRNRVIIQSNNGWQAFEDPFLKKYCNNELISSGLEAPWAETEDQKWAVADSYFQDMRRKLRRICIGIKGDPSLDVGDLVKVRGLISTANANYMITGIQTSFNANGYADILDLEFVTNTEGHICEKAEGAYEDEENSNIGTNKQVSAVTATLRDKIVNTALSYLGTYYQWGGDSVHNKNHYGMDCSHFTYSVLKQYGLMNSYHRAKDQYPLCTPVKEGNLQKGDLVFYSSGGAGSIYHVGMYIGNGKAISASGGGPSTTSIAKARASNAKVKVHNMKYMNCNYFYGTIKGL